MLWIILHTSDRVTPCHLCKDPTGWREAQGSNVKKQMGGPKDLSVILPENDHYLAFFLLYLWCWGLYPISWLQTFAKSHGQSISALELSLTYKSKKAVFKKMIVYVMTNTPQTLHLHTCCILVDVASKHIFSLVSGPSV